MVKYTIKMLQRASDDLDNIYNRIADDLEDAILSLDEMPYRGSIRRTGAFAFQFAMLLWIPIQRCL